MTRLMRGVFLFLGLLCLGLGAVGVALPILPTTPFLLLAAFFFAKSSDRLNAWFQSTSLYQSHLASLKRGEGMTRAAKCHVILSVTLIMGIAEFFMIRAYLIKGSKGALIGASVMGLVWLAHLIAFGLVIRTCPAERDLPDVNSERKGEDPLVLRNEEGQDRKAENRPGAIRVKEHIIQED